MKITYRTHVPLKWVFDRSIPNVINIDNKDVDVLSKSKVVLDVAEKAMIEHRGGYLKEAFVIREPFYNAVVSAEEKLFGVYLDCVEQGVLLEITATYLYRELVIFFHSKPTIGGRDSDTTLMAFHKDGTPVLLFVHDNKISDAGTLIFVSGLWLDYNTESRAEAAKKTVFSLIRTLIDFEIFKKFADVDTMFVSANSKSRNGLQRTVNETCTPLVFLDSKWFRNIVRSEGFAVRGHFRLQPKKVNGKWTKDLIWINDFEKHGYTSKAKILTQED